jgi:thiamine kinase-like enzyme
MLRVASHRDLNAHNALFATTGLSLIDWDAAGPTPPPWERANCATLWSAGHGGRYDIDAAIAFLHGYKDAGGEVTADDPDTLDFLLDEVESWTKKNVRWAITTPTAEQDHHVELLIGALLATPATIEERRCVLQTAISHSATAS